MSSTPGSAPGSRIIRGEFSPTDLLDGATLTFTLETFRRDQEFWVRMRTYTQTKDVRVIGAYDPRAMFSLREAYDFALRCANGDTSTESLDWRRVAKFDGSIETTTEEPGRPQETS